MSLRAVNFAARWSGLAALMTLGLTAVAQQSIQFTKPANPDPSATANSIVPANHKAPNDFNAPRSLFGDDGPTASFDVLPMGPAPVLPNAFTLHWQKLLQDRKNWTLKTPEEIMGSTTAEAILGLTPPEDSKLSLEERYLQRQDQQSAMAATNGLHHPDASWLRGEDQNRGLFQNRNDRGLFTDTSSGLAPATIPRNSTRYLNSFLSQNPSTPADVNQRSDPTWASAFGSPQPPPQATPEQIADMARFRALMDPSPAEKGPATANLFLPQATAPEANRLVQPAFNPIGHSVAPLQNDIAKPTGLTPLAGVTGPRPVPAKPQPLVQPPPWMSQSPQNSTLPQRQY